MQNLPPVEAYFVSHWVEDKYSQMAYSYVPVGSTGKMYDDLATPVKDKLFFAGEVGFNKMCFINYIKYQVLSADNYAYIVAVQPLII